MSSFLRFMQTQHAHNPKGKTSFPATALQASQTNTPLLGKTTALLLPQKTRLCRLPDESLRVPTRVWRNPNLTVS